MQIEIEDLRSYIDTSKEKVMIWELEGLVMTNGLVCLSAKWVNSSKYARGTWRPIVEYNYYKQTTSRSNGDSP